MHLVDKSILDDEDLERVVGLGEIIVIVHETNATRSPARSSDHLKEDLPDEVAEKALKGKAISHGVS